jgi:hypothetical protein
MLKRLLSLRLEHIAMDAVAPLEPIGHHHILQASALVFPVHEHKNFPLRPPVLALPLPILDLRQELQKLGLPRRMPLLDVVTPTGVDSAIEIELVLVVSGSKRAEKNGGDGVSNKIE